MASRIALNVRPVLLPMACTPLISRHAMPAIFCTTDWATLILPSSVCRRSGVAEPLLVAGVLDFSGCVIGDESPCVVSECSLGLRSELPPSARRTAQGLTVLDRY